MRIGGFGQYDIYSGLRSSDMSNRIKDISAEVNSITNESNESKEAEKVVKPLEDSSSNTSTVKRENINVQSLADRYKPVSSVDLMGRDSDIASLDVMKAVSDLSKDRTLQQYQYFVGDLPANDNLDEGIVMRKS